ncbi:hypothetical protein FQP90_07305 [Paenarthrobacter nitroguajacolicus]|uniref:Uncharacterized protein n=1 Tax=Paenarthrobacter nitroguajacolicus TaxID=211146 RepID=A0A558H6V2_PAENT|nr:hypothetical protein [Paenarthrobacter nitroguajacolicus]TVU64850.1 hypothetical protein FQP90_07305 [Paenarthrobacter nitroguajacolicus]
MTNLYLFHGGAPGLKVGDRVLPPTETRVKSQALAASLELGFGKIAQQLDKVYMTTDVKLARAYAGMWTDPASASSPAGGGVVYRVEVEDGTLEADKDLLSSPGVSYQASSAVVVDIQYSYVAFDKEEITTTLNRVLSAHEVNVADKAKQATESPAVSSPAGSSFFRPIPSS